MQTYRVTFNLSAPLLTPWQADTFFGHLCWALARSEGEAALADLLERCRAGNPPLLVSDGLPPDAFPRPLLPPVRGQEAGSQEADDMVAQIADARRGKAARDRKWLNALEFAQVLQGLPLETLADDAEQAPNPDAEKPFAMLHNQINRGSGTTTGADDSDAGELFAVNGESVSQRVVYARVADDIGFNWQGLFSSLCDSGFGKRKSVGYGAVSNCSIEEFAGFGEPENANGFVSLSAFAPASGDPTEGYWKADVKYGKLGEERANLRNPFKRPLVRLLAGAVFRTAAQPLPFYGRLVDGISLAAPDAAQYGFAFAVPLRIP